MDKQKAYIEAKLQELGNCDYYIIAFELKGLEVMGDCLYRNKMFLKAVLLQLSQKTLHHNFIIIGFKDGEAFCDRQNTITLEVDKLKGE